MDGHGTTRNVSLLGQRVVRDDPQAVASEVARWVADLAQRSVDDHGSFSIALAGGSTPRLLYDALAGPAWRDRVDWPMWHVFFGDERACPAGDPSSNYHLAETTLLSRVSIDPARVHRMPADSADLDAASIEYSDLLAASLSPNANGAPRLDVVLLGLGENGHTASLFPGTPALDVTDRWATRGLADYVPYDRMTLTYPAINAAAAVGFMVTGPAKVPALAATARGEVPASRVSPVDGVLVWFLDAAAAS
jgi:6-phosphogluconolactonase